MSSNLFSVDDVPTKTHPRSERSDGGGQVKMDGWKNVLSGMGYRMDKRKYTSFSKTSYLDENELAEMYRGDGLTRRIVDTRPDDMTRQWFDLEEDEKNVICDELERLDAQEKVNTALKWARLFGGALLVVGAMDGQAPDKPLKVDRIKNIEYLTVYDLGDINTASSVFDDDPKSPTFGQILQYNIRVRVGTRQHYTFIHASRCLPFYGLKIPRSTKAGMHLMQERYWGVSVMEPVMEYLRDYMGIIGSTSMILQEFIIGKYKFADLDEMLAQGNETALHTRVEAIEMTKSILHAVLLGTDEEYTRDSATVTGIPDVIDRFMMNLSAVTGYPVSKLFGRSPAGLNATGENDLKNYYDAIRADQRRIGHTLQILVDMLAQWKGIETSPIIWNSLFQLSQEEEENQKRIKAETYRTQAAGDQLYLNEGVLMPEDIYKLRFEELLGERDASEFEMIVPYEEEEIEEEPSSTTNPPASSEEGPDTGSGV